ncbi:MAG: SGNH/GDSL hydrolase family protein [Spirochaetota bacterium]
MKTILCFGDSNTWGSDPVGGGRHAYEDRWPTVLGREIGDGYLVIPEGLSGRTASFDDPIEGDKNGRRHLPVLLASHAPLDLVIIMLGTNDLKARFSAPAVDIAAGVGGLVDIVRSSGAGRDGSAPEVFVLVPGATERLSGFAETFAGAEEKSRELPRVFAAMCEQRNVPFAWVNDAARCSQADGIHLEADAQRALGSFVAQQVRALDL